MIGSYSINVRVKVQVASGHDIVADKYLIILDQLAVYLNPSFKDNTSLFLYNSNSFAHI